MTLSSMEHMEPLGQWENFLMVTYTVISRDKCNLMDFLILHRHMYTAMARQWDVYQNPKVNPPTKATTAANY